jgi:AraC family transcriptional regulator of arabinose operon
VKKNQIFTIPAHVPNNYQADAEEPWSFIWIGFTGELTQHFSTLPPVMKFHSNLFFEMTHVQKLTSMQEEFLVGKLFDLYRTLFSTETSPNYINAVQNYINFNYMQPDISIESIATSLNLNRSYLTRLFKRSTNMSIQYYLIKTRMEYAIRLLKSGCSVHDTARQVGYVDPFNFSKAFKHFYGISPSCYKSVPDEEKGS